MSLQEDFQELGYELAKFIKIRIKTIKKTAKETISVIEEDTKKKIKKDLYEIERDMVRKKEFELNKIESKKISEINQKIIYAKRYHVNRFIGLVADKVKEKVKEKPEKYFEHIFEKFLDFYDLITTPVNLQFNTRDLKSIEKDPKHFPLSKEHFKLVEISKEPIKTISGFMITAKDNSFVINNTFESEIERHTHEIGVEFMKIFPVFEVNVDNAIDLYEKLYPQQESK